MTHWSQISFESRLSDRNEPLGSDQSVLSAQNSASESRSGRWTGAGAGAGAVGGSAGLGAAAAGGCETGGVCGAHEGIAAATAKISDAVPARRFHSIDNQLTPQPAS